MNILNTVESSISEFIKESIGIDTLNSDMDIFETGIVNSLFAIQLMSYIENNFNIRIDLDDLDMDNFRSVKQMVEFVIKKQTEGLS